MGPETSRAGMRAAQDLLNEAILHVDVSVEGLVIVHNPAAFDQKPVTLRREQRGGRWFWFVSLEE